MVEGVGLAFTITNRALPAGAGQLEVIAHDQPRISKCSGFAGCSADLAFAARAPFTLQ